jgi:hypothetical protein
MAAPQDSHPSENEVDTDQVLVEVRYFLPALLREVKRDRASRAFAMEKLDQAAITTLFEQQQLRARREHDPAK